MLCFEEPTKYAASGPDSSRIVIAFFVISSSAWSQLMRWYLPFTSFIGYFSRCESSVMPCSRTAAPFAQCEPRLIGESNTGSWPTQTPFRTTASMAQPTEQCVQTERLTTVSPACFACASALSIMLNGSCDANAPAPTVTPDRLRKVRRSIVRVSAPDRLRARRDCGEVVPADFLVRSMAGYTSVVR